MTFPQYHADLFDTDGIEFPYPHYAAIRDLGPVVELTKTGVLAVGRYADVKKALLDHKAFISGEGVAITDMLNRVMARGATLANDPPQHQKLRSIISAPLQPAALAELKDQFQQAADDLIDRLVIQRSFDGIRDLARFLPVSIVSNLVGLPEEGRERMLDWASASFDALGPDNDLMKAAMPIMGEQFAYALNHAGPHQVKPGSWAARVYAAADEGLISMQQAPLLLFDYLGPSLDTTISATGHLLHQLAQHPEQWALLQKNPALIPSAIDEAVRLESPIRAFTRLSADESQIGGVAVPAGSRLLLLYGSANRDERKWDRPACFDIRRSNVSDQIGFGVGRHVCAGQHLARLEMACILRAMVERIETFEVGEPVIQHNNFLRCFKALPVQIH